MSTPQDLWLERSRFSGMLLDGVSYGILFVLTIQCVHALIKGPQNGGEKTETRGRVILLVYIFITFALATIGLAVNAKYSQMIWIDLRDTPGGPEGLIVNELGFWENRTALTSYYIMSWLMDVLLIHRCFVIWNRNFIVVSFMCLLLLANIITAILVLVDSSKGAVFTNINFQLAYLSISVSTNFIYTILVASRLLSMRKQIKAALGDEHSKVYTSVASMIVESSALYSVAGVFYVITFALHNNMENLIFLWIIHVQAIAQLLIILRVAQGRAYTQDVTARSTSLVFASRSASRSGPSANQPSHGRTATHDSFSITPGLPSRIQTTHDSSSLPSLPSSASKNNLEHKSMPDNLSQVESDRGCR